MLRYQLHLKSSRLKLALKVFGEIEMDFASGENSRFKDISLLLKDMRDTGRIQKRNVDFTESLFFLMMKTQESLLRDSKMLMIQDAKLIPFSSITFMLKICQLIRFLKSIITKLIEF
jgi:hypothetical protein